ncbi:MAG: hypothetical protein KDB02_01105 [Acidimicrobiales bacterium]|nr:hypothetical protein [Acidimicrobiales bacterium]
MRDESVPADGIVIVRGGPTSLAKVLSHAQRTHDAFVLDGQPVLGISLFCALDDLGGASLDSLLHRFASYRVVHLPRVSELRDAGFGLLPTFGRPHCTVTLDGLDQAEALLAALGKAEPNPYHERRPGRR